MGYTHYFRQTKPFTKNEWKRIIAEAKCICAKAQLELYAGEETEQSGAQATLNPGERGFATDFAEKGPWRTFPNPERDTPAKGKTISLAGGNGHGRPEFTDECICLNGLAPEDYETFILERAPEIEAGSKEAFNFCKTEYRPYDAVVVSILAAARTIAPDKIKVSSDGGDAAIKYIF